MISRKQQHVDRMGFTLKNTYIEKFLFVNTAVQLGLHWSAAIGQLIGRHLTITISTG